MVFVSNPNLPDKPAGLALVGSRISDSSVGILEGQGVKTLLMPAHSFLYDAVSSHPDILLHHVSADTIVYAPGTDDDILEALKAYGFKLLCGEKMLSASYPDDIAYNVARVGKYYFHNLKYTDRLLMELLNQQGIEPVHVEQGYSKCSVLPVDEKSMITTDAGIAKAAQRVGLDVLLAECGSSIRLPGLNYGFIGGACGLISKSTCAVNGSLEKLDGSEAIISFLSKRQIRIVELCDDFVTDVGSIIPLMCSNTAV